MDHEVAAQRARLIAERCAARAMDRDAISRDLLGAGWSQVEIDIGVEVVVSAFGWTILRQMGVTNFSSFFVLQQSDGNEVQLPVAEAHLFSASLLVAGQLFEQGWTDVLPKGGVTSIVSYSSEVGAVSKALDENPDRDLNAGTMTTSFYRFEEQDFRKFAGYPSAGVEPRTPNLDR